MSLPLYLSFVMASLALLLLPGPNVAVIVASSMERGRAAGLWTVAGTSAAMVIQLTLVVLGMAALTVWLAEKFEWIRWAGVVYLVLLGVAAWRAGGGLDGGAAASAGVGSRGHWLRGFLVSLTNPKTLLFYGAFMPQFVTGSGSAAAELTLLAGTFVVMAVVVDSLWALLAARVRGILGVSARIRNRLTAVLLVGAAAGLAAVRRP